MLDICREFFNQLNTCDVRYCHWKSNSHLREALDGQTDLDLLIHKDDQLAFNKILRAFYFLKMSSPAMKRFPYMDDYLGFDETSGKLIHLHVHYRLILGQRFIKNHHLPIEALFFENRMLKDGVFVPAPELELLILVIRASMKTGIMDVVRQAARDILGKEGTGFPSAIEREFHQLIATANQEKLLAYLAKSGLPIAPSTITDFLNKFISNKLKFHDLIRMNISMLLCLRGFQRMGARRAIPRYAYLLLVSQPRLKLWFPSQRKTLPENGFAVAVVGADGSGKSTLTYDLRQWLSWKLAVTLHYYGIPKTRRIRSFHFLIRAANASKFPQLGEMLTNLLWVMIARCRAAVSHVIQQEMNQGFIAIIDRFPMDEFRAMRQPMDGPRIKNEKGKINMVLTDLERSCYARIRRPDLILVLQAPVEILRQRKTDLDFATHVAKAQAVNALTSNQDVVLLDATFPYAEVLLCAKTAIWKHLCLRSPIIHV